jgi:outer membrane lipoprotein SlyB
MHVRHSRMPALVLALVSLIFIGGCAPERSGDVYQRGEALCAQSVEFGSIDSLRPVRIEGEQSGVGTVGGAVLGGIAGSTIGGGRGSAAGAVAGAILGGIVGNAVEKDVTKANGVEVTVRLDSGRIIAIVQQGSGEEFRPGDRVRVTSDGYTTRVTR